MLARRMGSVAGGLLLLAASGPAEASVFCVRPGYPVGCVSHPGIGTPGIPGSGVGAPGAGVTLRGPAGAGGATATRGAGAGARGPGVTRANRGGPVNRAGVQ